jgi:phosphopantothenoylcysteine decarboxylase/phosphopantothenate--cysteine ligase
LAAREKIKKDESEFSLALTKTKDILKCLGEKKRPDQFLAGFALETTNEKAYALAKIKDKNADMIVLNSLKDEGAGFGHDTNKISIFDKSGKVYLFEQKTKKEVATDIVNTIIQLMP